MCNICEKYSNHIYTSGKWFISENESAGKVRLGHTHGKRELLGLGSLPEAEERRIRRSFDEIVIGYVQNGYCFQCNEKPPDDIMKVYKMMYLEEP